MPWKDGTPIRTESSAKALVPKMERPKKKRRRNHPVKLTLHDVIFSLI